jgi:hypothetical protein
MDNIEELIKQKYLSSTQFLLFIGHQFSHLINRLRHKFALFKTIIKFTHTSLNDQLK